MKASGNSWKREPFKEGVPLQYSANFSAEEFAILQDGLVPKEMEDKWFLYYEEPYLFLHRSWTGMPAYRVELHGEASGGASCVEALWSTEGNLPNAAGGDSAYAARVLDFLISNLLLRQSKPFPMPALLEEPVRGLFQHVVAGTAFPQSPESKTEASSSIRKQKKT